MHPVDFYYTPLLLYIVYYIYIYIYIIVLYSIIIIIIISYYEKGGYSKNLLDAFRNTEKVKRCENTILQHKRETLCF